MYDDIMDYINNKAMEDANGMVFFGPDVSAQALMFHQGRISDAPEGTDYPPPRGVMLRPEFRGQSFNEIAKALDRYLEAFKKIEKSELRSAVFSVIDGDMAYEEIITLLGKASSGDNNIPDSIDVWASYAHLSARGAQDMIEKIYKSNRRITMEKIYLVCGINDTA